MPRIDFFHFFRLTLGTVVTIYVLIVTAQFLWSWYVWLSGRDKYIAMLRRYLVLHSLRLRFKTFWGDVLICGLLLGVFGVIWHAHGIIEDIEAALVPQPQTAGAHGR